MRVILSTRAKAQLRDIARYIAQNNKRRAVSFVKELEASAAAVGPMPHAFPVAAQYRGRDYHRKPHEAYLIFYHVEADRVVVDHIVHAARDYTPLLFP